MSQDTGNGCGTIFLVGVIAFSIYSCATRDVPSQSSAEQAVMSGDASRPGLVDRIEADVNPTRADFSEDRAEEAATDYFSGESFEGVQGSLDCTDDCSGHEAGWQWAKDGNSCGGGGSASFDAGCQAFEEAKEEKVDEARSSYEAGDDTFAGEN